MNIQLNNEQVKNLLIFLNRVDLKGAEALALVALIATVQKTIQKVASEPKDNKK